MLTQAGLGRQGVVPVEPLSGLQGERHGGKEHGMWGLGIRVRGLSRCYTEYGLRGVGILG